MKKKNLIKKIAFWSILGLGLSSCDDFLDTEPTNDIIFENFWQEKSDVEGMIASTYKVLASNDFVYRMEAWGEMRSDNIIIGDAAGNDERYLRNYVSGDIDWHNSLTSWGVVYQAIGYCNQILRYAPDVLERDPDFTKGDLAVVESEAYAIRALCYFYLLRAFRDVPLILEPVMEENEVELPAQSDPSVVLNQIITDLLTADGLAITSGAYTGSKSKYNQGRITRDAVRAILADVYLWSGSMKQGSKNDYEKCVEFCDSVINSKVRQYHKYVDDMLNSGWSPTSPMLTAGKYALIDNMSTYGISAFSNIFGTGNARESIFELQFDEEQNINSMVCRCYGNRNVEVGFLAAPSFFIEKLASKTSDITSATLFTSTDQRHYENINQISAFYPISKYVNSEATAITVGGTLGYSYISQPWSYDKDAKPTTLCQANWVLYRMTDVMLMKAEALVQLAAMRSLDIKEDSIKYEREMGSAFELVSAVWNRSNPTAVSKNDTLVYSKYKTVDAMESLVIEERQRELMFEGKRWFDLMRYALRRGNNRDMLNLLIRKFTEGSSAIKSKLSTQDALYLPINNGEMKNNPNLKQNPAYSNTNSSNRD